MTRDRPRYSVASTILAVLVLCLLPVIDAWAQFTDSFQTNIIDGVSSNWLSRSYSVGSNTMCDQLQIINGGTLSGGIFVQGFNIGYHGDSNSVVVTGPGSTLVSGYASCGLYVGNGGNGNQLSITDGGTVIQTWGIIGSYGNSNSVVVSGAGSVWSNALGGWAIGDARPAASGAGYYGTGHGNSLIVSNGGTLFSGSFGFDFRAGSGDVVGGTNNSILVTGAGSRYRSSGLGLGDGPYATGNSLVISNAGTATMTTACIGCNGGANNAAVVTGTGSVWRLTNLYLNYGSNFGPPSSASNSLVISDGGTVRDLTGYIGYGGGDGAKVIVTGSGSTWSNGTALYVGYQNFASAGNTLVISNGGKVTASLSYIGYSGQGAVDNNSVLVTGTGSVWSNRGAVYVGDGNRSGNSLTINDGGTVVASNVIVGLNGNSIMVNDGNLTATHSATGGLILIGGTVTMNGASTMSVDRLSVANGSSSVFTFNGGTLNTAGTTVNNGSTFTVGNGSSTATLNLEGGSHSFANGLVISNNAVLRGTGTIFANLTLTGTLSPGNSPGVITNFGNLTLQSSAVLDMQLGGTIQGSQYDFILVTNGTVTLDGLLKVSFINGFASGVSSNDTFVLLQGNSPLGGSFTNVIGGYLTTAGGEGTFYVDYGNNAVTLSGYQVAVPEPSALVLCAVALLALLAVRRKGNPSAG